jgi:hypothetical protein
MVVLIIPYTQAAEVGELPEFRSSRQAWETQRDPISKIKYTKSKQTSISVILSVQWYYIAF